MTSQDFLEKLSPQAKQIVSNYININSNKNKITVFITDYRSQMNAAIQDEYIIEIKQNPIFYQMEYEFLHEFFHCIQKDNGFPHIHAISPTYTKMAANISSVILDLDVTERLSKVGYPFNPNCLEESLNSVRKLLVISNNDSSVKKFIYEPNQFIYMSAITAYIRINYDKQNRIDQLLDIMKLYLPDMYRSQSIIYRSIKRVGYNTPQKVYKLLKILIRELKLEKYIEIS